MNDTYGLISFEPLASYDHDSHSWKMYAVISLWGLTECLETLPKSGMTRNGRLFQQPVLEPLIDATESSAWPTPRSNTAMASLITPEIAWDPKRFPNLETVVGRQMWPTPTTQEVEHPNATWVKEGQKLRRIGKGIRGHSMGLADSVRIWPTPRSSAAMADEMATSLDRVQRIGYKARLEEKVALEGSPTGRLNPTWVEWLMGVPLGWTDLDDLETQ